MSRKPPREAQECGILTSGRFLKYNEYYDAEIPYTGWVVVSIIYEFFQTKLTLYQLLELVCRLQLVHQAVLADTIIASQPSLVYI